MSEKFESKNEIQKTQDYVEGVFNTLLLRHVVSDLKLQRGIPDYTEVKIVSDDFEAEKIEILNFKNQCEVTLLRPALDTPEDSIYRRSAVDGEEGILFFAVIQNISKAPTRIEFATGQVIEAQCQNIEIFEDKIRYWFYGDEGQGKMLTARYIPQESNGYYQISNVLISKLKDVAADDIEFGADQII